MASKTATLGSPLEGKHLLRMAQWHPVERNGIHLIGTPDTEVLTKSIAEKIQALLDLSHKNNPTYYPKRNVMYTILNEYEFFGSGDPIPTLPDSVSGANVWLVSDPHGDKPCYNKQSKQHFDTISSAKYQHDKLLLEAIRKNGAHRTNIIMPAFYGARQDKPTEWLRQPTTVVRTGTELHEIVWPDGRVWTLDLHNPASIEHLWRRPANFYTSWMILQAAEKVWVNIREATLQPADDGGTKKIREIAKRIGCIPGKAFKQRDYEAGGINEIDVEGNIEWKDIILHDDILDTGGTLCTSLEAMVKAKPRSITIVITHGFFNMDAREKLRKVVKNSKGIIKWVFISDSINKENIPEFVTIISTAQLFANAIIHVIQGFKNLDKWDATDYVKLVG